MRSIVSPLDGFASPFGPQRGFNPFAAYAIGGQTPQTIADFEADKYRANGTTSTASSLLTHTRAGTATYTDNTGTLQTAATNELRKDNHIWDGSSWVKRCLVEPQSTNLATYSEDFSNAVWGSMSVTINTNQTTAPDGTSSADAISWPFSSAYIQQNGILTAGQTATISVWVKSNGGSQKFRLYGDNTIISSDFTATEEWQRFSFTFTVVTGGAGSGAGITRAASSSAFSGFIWGAQLEASSVPTSYIPTAGSQVTRPADALSIDSTLLPYDSTAMTIAMDGEMTYADTGTAVEVYWVRWVADANNGLFIYNSTAGANAGQPTFQQEESNILDGVVGASDAYAPGTNVPFNIASRHTSSDINGAVDGTALTADTTVTALPGLSATDFEIAPTGVVNIKSLRILGGYGATDAELEAATS